MAGPRFSFKFTILLVFAMLMLALSAAMLYLNYARNSEATLLAADNLLSLHRSKVWEQ